MKISPAEDRQLHRFVKWIRLSALFFLILCFCQVLIIAPTRELAIQIKDESRKFSNGTILKSAVVYGGTSVGYQRDVLSRGTYTV